MSSAVRPTFDEKSLRCLLQLRCSVLQWKHAAHLVGGLGRGSLSKMGQDKKLEPPFRFNRNGKGSQVAPLMTRRERNAKDPEARDLGKPFGCFRGHQRQNRGRHFATDHAVERFDPPFVELDVGRPGCRDRGPN